MPDLQFVILHEKYHYHISHTITALSTVHLILKKHLKVGIIFTRWVPHLLTDEQNRQPVKVAKKLLQMFQTYDKKQIANVVAGDKIGSIILSQSERLAIKSRPLNIADQQ